VINLFTVIDIVIIIGLSSHIWIISELLCRDIIGMLSNLFC